MTIMPHLERLVGSAEKIVFDERAVRMITNEGVARAISSWKRDASAPNFSVERLEEEIPAERPKSVTLTSVLPASAMSSANTSTFRTAKSRWTIPTLPRLVSPMQTCGGSASA